MTTELTIQEKLDLAEKNLEILLEWGGRFDNKSHIVLGIDNGVLGVLVTFAPPLKYWTLGLFLLTLLSVVGVARAREFFLLFVKLTIGLCNNSHAIIYSKRHILNKKLFIIAICQIYNLMEGNKTQKLC